MSALPAPRLFTEHNGYLNIEVCELEPSVAAGAPLLPTPTSLLVEGTADGPNYPRQNFSRIIEAELDDNLRVVREISHSTNSRVGESTTVIEREWHGSDYDEVTRVNEDSPVEGFRHTLDDGVLDVSYGGSIYRITKLDAEDGGVLWVSESSEGLRISSWFDADGKITAEEFMRTDKSVDRVTYTYDVNGRLLFEVAPGNIYTGDSRTPYDKKTTYEYTETEKGHIVVVKKLPFPDSPDNPEYREERKYGRSGEYQGSKIINGFPDVGRISTKRTVEYKILAST